MSPVPGEDRNKPTQDSGLDIEDTEYPDVIINAESSDSDNANDDDDDDNGYMGYQALSQDGFQADSDNDDEPDTAVDSDPGFQPADPASGVPTAFIPQGSYPDFPNTANLPSYMQVPDIPRPDRTEILWNQPRTTDIRLDTGQADKIRSLMTDIRLPSTNIPDWAQGMSEDQWQAQVNKLVNTKTSPKQEAGAPSNLNTEQTVDKTSTEES